MDCEMGETIATGLTWSGVYLRVFLALKLTDM